ncbi:MAG: type II toxin-antitoxin system VapC family toxin [Nitrospirota bacterium]
MKKKRLLDSFALLAYLKKENNWQRVKDLLSSADNPLLMNDVNVGETYYILARERSMEQADAFLDVILPSLPIIVRSNSFEHVIEASKIKARHPLSFADCFAAATALRENAVIVTGDPEFKHVRNLIDIEWL